MREPLSLRTPSRIKGRPALVRRLRGLLLAVHRYSRHRASSHGDQWWSARTIDALTVALSVATETTSMTNDKRLRNDGRGLQKLASEDCGNRSGMLCESACPPFSLGEGDEAADRA